MFSTYTQYQQSTTHYLNDMIPRNEPNLDSIHRHIDKGKKLKKTM